MSSTEQSLRKTFMARGFPDTPSERVKYGMIRASKIIFALNRETPAGKKLIWPTSKKPISIRGTFNLEETAYTWTAAVVICERLSGKKPENEAIKAEHWSFLPDKELGFWSTFSM